LSLAYVLLGLAICAVWLPALRVANQKIPPWTALFAPSIAVAIASGVLTFVGLASLVALVACAWASTQTKGAASVALMVLAALIALCLSLHLLPGFQNPMLFANEKLRVDAKPFTQRINFDKGAAGLVLLAFFAPRLRAVSGLVLSKLMQTIWMALAVCALTMGVAVAIGLVRFDPSLPAKAVPFLLVNLLFTCVAEEAFFRGWMQEQLSRIGHSKLAPWIAALVSGVLFGLAHFSGGPLFMVAATVAGLGYAVVYARSRSIEAALFTHFAVNAVHFFGFSYPTLAS
jgi:uncharacterized protein